MNAKATNTDPGSRSAAEIEREVQQSRADIEHTLDAIQDKLSPGQLVDQTLGYFRGGRGADFARNLGDSITQNPMPVALMGVGLAWMMFSGQRSARDEDRAGPAYWDDDLDEIEGHYGEMADESMAYLHTGADVPAGEGYGDARGGVGDRLKEAGGTAKDKLGEFGDQARDAGQRAREQAERARARVERAGAGVADRAHETRARARRYGRRARQGMLRSLDEHPLVLGAIGLAIGAALGAALPPSETEDELMGETRDKALRRATRVGREQAEKLRETAGAVAAAAREEAHKQGSTPESSSEPRPSGATSSQAAAGAARVDPGQGESAVPASDTPYPADPKASLDRP